MEIGYCGTKSALAFEINGKRKEYATISETVVAVASGIVECGVIPFEDEFGGTLSESLVAIQKERVFITGRACVDNKSFVMLSPNIKFEGKTAIVMMELKELNILSNVLNVLNTQNVNIQKVDTLKHESFIKCFAMIQFSEFNGRSELMQIMDMLTKNVGSARFVGIFD